MNINLTKDNLSLIVQSLQVYAESRDFNIDKSDKVDASRLAIDIQYFIRNNLLTLLDEKRQRNYELIIEEQKVFDPTTENQTPQKLLNIENKTP